MWAKGVDVVHFAAIVELMAAAVVVVAKLVLQALRPVASFV